jgi:uncharacterized membrane protein
MVASVLSQSTSAQTLPSVRRIGAADIRFALQQGWNDFKAKRGEMIFLGLIYPLVGLISYFLVSDRNVAPLAFPLTAGLSLMGPLLATGFYEIARRRENGQDSRWIHAFDVLKTGALGPVAVMTGVMVVFFGLWLAAAWAIYSVTMAGVQPLDTAAFWNRLFTTPGGWALIIVGNVVGFGFALVVATLTVISLPMLVDRPVDPIVAMKTSLRAVAASPGTFAAWGLIVAGLLILGSIPLFVGLAVVLPVLGYATWHLYTRAIER